MRVRLFLRTDEMFLQNNTTRNAILILIDQGVVSAANFLTGIIIGRICTKEEFGIFTLGFTIVIFIMGIQVALVSSPYTIYSPRLKEYDKYIYTGSTLVHQLCLSAIATIFLLVTSTILSFDVGSKKLSPVLLSLSAAITAILLKEYVRQICFAHFRVKAALIIDSCVTFIQITSLVALAHMKALSANRAYLIIGFACIAVAPFWLIGVRKEFVFSMKDVASDLKRNWVLGRWILAGSLAFAASSELYPWLLAILHGVAATGILAACNGVLSITNPFVLGIGNFLNPRMAEAFAKGGTPELHRVALKGVVVISSVMSLFILAMVIYGGSAVELIYGVKYTGNGVVVGTLSISLFFSSMAVPLHYGLLAMERSDIAFKANIAGLGITITLGLWLVKSFGPLGVGFSFVLISLIGLTIKYRAYIKEIHRYGRDEAKHFVAESK